MPKGVEGVEAEEQEKRAHFHRHFALLASLMKILKFRSRRNYGGERVSEWTDLVEYVELT